MADAVIAPGTTLTANVSGSQVPLGEIQTIDNVDSLEYAKIRTTHQGSTYRDHTPGLPGWDDMTVTLNYTRTGAQNCRALRGVKPKTFVITFSNGDAYTITGWMTKSSASVPEPEGEEPDTIEAIIAVNSVSFTPGS
jgi:hypothetical protein